MGGFRGLITGLIVVTLSACGGGGGGGGMMTPMPTPAPASVIFTDSADSFSPDGTPAPTNSMAAGANAAQITLTADSTGQARFLTVSVPLASGSYTHTFDLSKAAAGVGALTGFTGVKDGLMPDGVTPQNLIVFDPSLNFSVYGVWASPQTGAAGAIAFGNMTPAAAITPSLGTATYNGKTVGSAVNLTDNSARILTGTVTLNANFSLMMVNGTFNITATDTKGNAAPWANLTMPSTSIAPGAGGAYFGALTGSTMPDNTPVKNSDVYGHFYGPMANETAGTWSASNSAWLGFGGFGGARH